MFRVGILLENKKVISKNFPQRDEAEDWVLSISEKQKVKRADLLNLETKKRERIF